MNTPLKLGLAGFGKMGRLHAKILSQLPDMDLVGVHDPDSEAQILAERLRIPIFNNFSDMLESVDALIVAAPTSLHAELVLGALDAGCHVLVEKPLARTVAEGEAIVKAAAEKKFVVQVGHIERFNPAVEYLIQHPSPPRYIQADRLAKGDGRAADVGVIHDLMIHDLDIVLSLVDSPVVSYQVMGLPVLSEFEDIVHVRLTFENGCMANLSASRVSRKPQRSLRVFYEDRYASVDTIKSSVRIYEKKVVRGKARISGGRVRLPAQNPLAVELASFGAAIRGEAPCRVTAQEGFEALKLADGLLRVLENQRSR